MEIWFMFKSLVAIIGGILFFGFFYMALVYCIVYMFNKIREDLKNKNEKC